MTNYIYAFIRKDLPLVHQIIQIGHVCHEAGQKTSLEIAPNLCLLQVESEIELLAAANHLRNNNIQFELFQEDDMEDDFTAICSAPVSTKEERAVFKRFNLYKE